MTNTHWSSLNSEGEREARKAFYQPDREGQVHTCAEQRWSVERVATDQAVAEFERLAAEALRDAHAGRRSPLAYHMYRMRMDPPTLAQATGLWRWQVHRHLDRPQRFRRISRRAAQRYCRALGMSWEALLNLPSQEGRGEGGGAV